MESQMKLFKMICFTLLFGVSTSAYAAQSTPPFPQIPGKGVITTPSRKPAPSKTPEKFVPDSAIYTAFYITPKKGEKSYGGLTCVSTPAYKCTIAAKHDTKLIYTYLKLPEKNVTSALVLGSKTVQKKVGRLMCTKTTPVVPKPVPSYFCSLK
jgi:hypothetical protein